MSSAIDMRVINKKCNFQLIVSIIGIWRIFYHLPDASLQGHHTQQRSQDLTLPSCEQL